MKQKLIRIIFCMLLIAVWVRPAYGAEKTDESQWEYLQEQTESLGLQEITEDLSEETKDYLAKLNLRKLDGRQILSLTPKQLWLLIKEMFVRGIKAPLSLFGALSAVILLCAAVQALKSGFHADGLERVFAAVSAMCIMAVILEPVTQCVQRVSQTVQDSAAFLNGYIPVFCGVLTVSGQPATAGIYHLLLFGASQVIAQAVSQLILPLIGIFLAFCFVGAMTPDLSLEKLSSALKKLIGWGLGLMLTVYVGLLGLQSMVAAGADSITMKTAKFVTSSFIPVIGSALSDAMMTARACLKLLKTSVGVYGILIAVLTFLPLFLEILCWYLSAQGAAMLGHLAGAKTPAKLMDGIADALGILLSILLLFCLLFIISTTIMLIVGAGG